MTEYSDNLTVADVEAIPPAPQPEGDTGPSVVCNGCGWEGHEDGLIATLDAEDGEPSRACPECRTDCNLMDHPPRPSVSVAAADQFDRADWFWRDLDPDDSGDTGWRKRQRAALTSGGRDA